MRPYSKYKPTGFDQAGLGCEDQQDWLVAPCGRNRDSEALEESNFRVLVKILQEKFEETERNWNMGVHPPGSVFREDGRKDYEVHRFGHWACGWLEIILVRPGTPCAQEAEECENALADYSVLNDSDHSELEHEEAQKTWSACFSVRERIEYMWDHQSDFEHCFWRGSDPITHQQRTAESETEEHALERWRMILANVRGTCFSGTPSEILG